MKRKDVEKTRYLSKKMDIAMEKLLNTLHGISPEGMRKYEDMKEKAITMKLDGVDYFWIAQETGVWVGGAE